jgi:hypothetical protein
MSVTIGPGAIDGGVRRRGGRVAECGASAACGNAVSWILASRVDGRFRAFRCGVSERLESGWSAPASSSSGKLARHATSESRKPVGLIHNTTEEGRS